VWWWGEGGRGRVHVAVLENVEIRNCTGLAELLF
jgi:hypothetical protein